MKLSTPDEDDEESFDPDESSNKSLEELRQRVDDLEERTEVPFGLDTIDELAAGQQAVQDNLEDRLDTLESRVDRQEAVLYELIETVEVLGAAADPNDLEAGRITVANEGSDGYPWKWDTETLEFKAEEFE